MGAGRGDPARRGHSGLGIGSRSTCNGGSVCPQYREDGFSNLGKGHCANQEFPKVLSANLGFPKVLSAN